MELFKKSVLITALLTMTICYQPVCAFDFNNFKNKILKNNINQNISEYFLMLALEISLYAFVLSRGSAKSSGCDLWAQSLVATLLHEIMFNLFKYDGDD